MSNIEEMEFTTDKTMVMHYVKSQAGTLAKALLESVQNSFDAGATRIYIDLNSNWFSITDDGEGISTRESILAVFNTFGFDHSQHQRKLGQFGLGRAAIWNWASTKWFTHNFMLDVNIRERGLKWHLTSDMPNHHGLKIEGTFYEPQSAVVLTDTIRDLSKFCRYLSMPVYVNGERINRAPEDQRWTHESDSFYLSLTEGHNLAVYNQGIYVCDIYAGSAGAGGTLVSKVGHPVAVNMTRNDVVRSNCAVWKAAAEVIKTHTRERNANPKARVTDADRDFLANQLADPDDGEAFEQAIFTLSTGRHITLQRLLALLKAGASLSRSERGSQMAERLYRDGRVIPLADMTLARFNAPDVASFARELLSRCNASHAVSSRARLNAWTWPLKALANAETFEDIKKCPGYTMLEASTVPDKELTKPQLTAVRCIRNMAHAVRAAMYESTNDSSYMKHREIVIGRSESALAYTDGATYVALVDTFVSKCMQQGLSGFLTIAQVLVHEHLHSQDSKGSHIHDLEFYEEFHDITIHQGHILTAIAASAYKRWCAEQTRMSRKRAADLDMVNNDKSYPVDPLAASTSDPLLQAA